MPKTNEYYDLLNKECYAPTIVGRKLNQAEVDKVVMLCNASMDCWGEEHLIAILRSVKGLFIR